MTSHIWEQVTQDPQRDKNSNVGVAQFWLDELEFSSFPFLVLGPLKADIHTGNKDLQNQGG